MTKRTTISCAVGTALATGVIFLSSLPASAMVGDLDAANEENPAASCSPTLSGPEREQRRLWPATYYPPVAEVTRPQFVELTQASGPARAEYRLWPVIAFSKVPAVTRTKTVELAQTTGPERAEYRLWSIVAPATPGSPQNNEAGTQMARTIGTSRTGRMCPIAAKPTVLASR